MRSRRPMMMFCAALVAPAFGAEAQEIDMAAMMKWGSADVIRYHIVGEYKGQPYIAGDGAELADVTDRVVIDLTWKLSESGLVGMPSFQNAKSALTNPRDREPSCFAPVLKGEYEHYELQGIAPGLGGALALQVLTIHPEVEIAQFCTASRKAVPARRRQRPEEMVVPSPVMLAMPLPDSDLLRVSADRKSLISKKDGWTWTFTPSLP